MIPPLRKTRAASPKFAKFTIHVYIGIIRSIRPASIVMNLFMWFLRRDYL